MPLYCTLITNVLGNLLFSKYFIPQFVSSVDSLLFEQRIYKNVSNYELKGNMKRTVTIDNVHVVFQKIGDLVVYIGGDDDIDELIRMKCQ
jgi:hypothetical protein